MFNKIECALKLPCCSLTINFSEKMKHNERVDKMRVTSGHLLFFQRNTKFYSCNNTAIRFLTAKHEILQLHPSGFSFFYSEMQNFKNCTQTAIRFSQRNIKFRTAAKLPFMTTKHEIFKVVPKQSFAQIDFKNSSNK